jgi:outer membrane receptor protein involved in Fe transport
MADPYAIANVRADYESDDKHWGFGLFVTNAFDKVHLINGTGVASVDGSVLGIYGSPRWFGGRVSYRW